jgi:ABC-2 type transport system permease protein
LNGLFRLTLRQILGGKKVWLLGIALCLPVVLLGMVLAAGGFVEAGGSDGGEIALSIFLYVLYPQVLCILASLIYGSSLLVREVEDKTLVYLFSRAQPRWKILLSKYVTTVLVLSSMITVSMTLCFVLAGMPVGLRLWSALFTTICAGCAAYTAIFSLLGIVLPQRAVTVGLIYAVVVEFMLTMVPALINEMTVSHYLRALALRIAEVQVPKELTILVGETSMSTTVIALVLFPVLSLSLASLVIHKREWPLTEGV